MDLWTFSLGLVSFGAVIWLTVQLDRVTSRLDAIDAHQDTTNKRLDLLAISQGKVLADVQRRAKRRAREASQEAP